MYRIIGFHVLVLISVLSSACTYHRAYIDHAENEGKILIQAAAWDGELVAPIRAGEAGAIWEKCTNIARGSIWVLMDDARKLGANAIGDVRWVPQDPKHTTNDPSCKKKWGWFLLWPALVTPAFQSARVDANAYLVPEDSRRAGVYLIPDSRWEQAQVVEKILDDTFLHFTEESREPHFETCSIAGG